MSRRPPPPEPTPPPDPGLPFRRAAGDGLLLAGRRWPAAPPVRGRVLLIHGLNEHLGRHAETADRLAAAGWTVQGVDLRGHGRSDGQRGHVRRWQDYHLDVEAAARDLDDFFILAHSMGGLIALDWLLTGGGLTPRIQGLILSCPLLAPALEVPGWKLALGRALARFLPWVPIPSGMDPAGLAMDLAVVQDWREDPLAGSTVTPRWFEEMEAAVARVRDRAQELRLPVQLHVSSRDPFVDSRAAVEFVRRCPGPVEIHEWRQSLHEPLHDLEKEAVHTAVLAWLDQRAAAAGSSATSRTA